jgi:tripartite-type tricarboxylate transporter receptor subunit TctC
MFAQKAGIKLQHVPYKGASEVMTGMLSGSVDMMFVTPPSVQGLLKEGRVRALAFTGTKPFPAFPEVPLLKDLVPGYEPQGSWGMFLVPAKTPEPIIEKLNASIRKALQAPEVAAVIQRDGYLPDNRNADEAAAFFRKEVLQAAEAVKAAGIESN